MLKFFRRLRLAKSLDALCTKLDRVYNINSGGCCYLAFLIARNLDQLEVKYELVVYSPDKKDSIKMEEELKNRTLQSGDESVIMCDHYCLYIYNYGIINRDNRHGGYIVKNVSSNSIGWIYKLGGWNPYYKKSNNSIVKDIVNDFFKKYK